MMKLEVKPKHPFMISYSRYCGRVEIVIVIGDKVYVYSNLPENRFTLNLEYKGRKRLTFNDIRRIESMKPEVAVRKIKQ